MPAGFTLVEILVVVVILAVAVTATLTALSSRRGDLSDEARRLAGALEGLAMEARLSGRPVGWRCVPGGFEFLRWVPQVLGERTRSGSWQPLGPSPWRLADGVVISSVSVNGKDVQCDAQRLVLPALAAAPVFRLVLTDTTSATGAPAADLVLQSDPAGRFAVLPTTSLLSPLAELAEGAPHR